jgi:hypothetical protein
MMNGDEVTGKKISVIEKTLDDADKAIVHLEEAVKELRNRLLPISLTEPIPKKDESIKTTETTKCTIDSRIAQIGKNIMKQCLLINIIKDELQI